MAYYHEISSSIDIRLIGGISLLKRGELEDIISEYRQSLSDGELIYIGFGFAVLEPYADQRLSRFQTIKQLVCAHAIKLVVQDRVLVITDRGLETFHQQLSTIEYWMDEMRKIQEIEKFYGIRIRLKEIKTL